MAAVLLGVFAALCWSLHDLVARSYAERIGPFRMAAVVMVAGAALLLGLVLWRGSIWTASGAGLMEGLLLGLAYGLGVGGLFKAFSLGPISLVGPVVGGYPILVVFWGVAHGLAPTALEWAAVAATFAGAVIVARSGPAGGGINAVTPGKLPELALFGTISALGYAAAIVIGQNAAVSVGEIEATFLSRFTAFLVILPFLAREARPRPLAPAHWLGMLAMALLDVLGLVAVNASGHLPGKTFAAIGIAAYSAIAVVLAMLVLKEKVSAGQWLGILMICAGVATLSLTG
ncbi:MAG: DMT family transporter [Hyphomicrobiales bacterium]